MKKKYIDTSWRLKPKLKDVALREIELILNNPKASARIKNIATKNLLEINKQNMEIQGEAQTGDITIKIEHDDETTHSEIAQTLPLAITTPEHS